MKKWEQITAGLYFWAWSLVIGLVFVVAHVGPCNNHDIPMSESAPIVITMIAYGLAGLLLLMGKVLAWPYWGIAGGLLISALTSFGSPFDLNEWTDGLYYLGLPLLAGFPALSVFLYARPSMEKRKGRALLFWTGLVLPVVLVAIPVTTIFTS